MSVGYGAKAIKLVEDKSHAIYLYSGFNLNLPESSVVPKSLDGIIMLDKSALIEPELHIRKKRLPSGRKREIIKRILREVSIEELLEGGKIEIENCKNTWEKRTSINADIMAIRVCRKIFQDYQMEGQLPEGIEFFA